MRHPRHRGFTLVELLVIIVILGLLITILFPSLRRTINIARRTQCSFNLAHVGQAFAARGGEEGIRGRLPFKVRAWAAILLPYLGDDAEVLLCPEGGTAMESAVWSGLGAEGTMELLRVRFYGRDGFDYFAELNGPFVARMSDTQHRALRAANYLRHNANLLNYSGYNGYEADGNPDVIWYCIEELQPASEYMQRGNPAHDYEDIRMRVTTYDDGSLDLYFELGSGQIDADILAQGRSQPLATIPRGHPRAPRSAGPFDADEIGGVGGSWAGVPTSYAMNSAVMELVKAQRKILALDYQNKAVAESDEDSWRDRDWDPDRDGVPLFARHMGQANVLFMDGSVESMRPRRIDPSSPSIARDYWEP